MDLTARTHDVLDWSVVVEALAEQARTPMGAREVRELTPLSSPDEVRFAYDATEEWLHLTNEELWTPPIGGVGDPKTLLIRASKGEVLEPVDLKAIANAMDAMRRVVDGLQERDAIAPVLHGLSAGIVLDLQLCDALERSFDPTGQLSAAEYPELGELRARIQEIHQGIRRTLDSLLRDDDMKDILQDDFVAFRGERYVLPIKAHAKRWDLGIVHGTSGSGKTAFIEPTAVIALNNQLRITEGQLEAAERAILLRLSRWVGSQSEDLLLSLEAIVTMDLAASRAGLAQKLDLTRPAVMDQGVVRLRGARHPVLALRGVGVVGNDLTLDATHRALMLTGPNTGGKTIALKTVGLCALMVRSGCFVPAAEGSRCDLFGDVFADIGDAQAVSEDLSSFSAHLLALRHMLDATDDQTLVLLDEMCSGTDPSQGAALARAVLEALLDRGAAIVATTHFAQLKALAQTEQRAAMAAMEYAGGRPTYRVLHDATGESHALEAATVMGLPSNIVDRAKTLLGQGERALSDALASLDQQRDKLAVREAELSEAQAEARAAAAELARKQAQLDAKLAHLEAEAGERFLQRLRNAEKAISAVVADLQRAPSHEGVSRAKRTISAFETLAPQRDAPAPPASVPPEQGWQVGDRVRLVNLGQVGEVQAVGAEVTVRVGMLTLRVPPTDLEAIGTATRKPKSRKKKRIQADTRDKAPRVIDPSDAVRLPTNTLDLRGQRVDEGLEQVDAFIDRALMQHLEVIFVLHGHGTGAMKQAVRRHLKQSSHVTRSVPANADQGGDAYTIALIG